MPRLLFESEAPRVGGVMSVGTEERHAVGTQRIAVIGNAGSGKTYLARHLSAIEGVPLLDLDMLFWLRPGDYTAKRPVDDVARLIETERRKVAWVVEGVYGELVEPFLASAQQLFWLDLPWVVCQERIAARQLARGLAADTESYAALVRYAAAYWQRDDGRSHTGHGRLFEAFAGEKHQFTAETSVSEFLRGHAPA
ncbi:MAG: hypothetical protein U0Q11_25680 [Vicinamibacterales bacterium]